MATTHLDTWEQLIGNRKSPLRSAAVIGFDILFKMFTRQIAMQDLVEQASRRLGIKGRAIVWSQAEPCMDVDKPHQLEIMREDLARQKKKAASAEKKLSAVKKPAKSPAAKKTTTPKAKAKAKLK